MCISSLCDQIQASVLRVDYQLGPNAIIALLLRGTCIQKESFLFTQLYVSVTFLYRHILTIIKQHVQHIRSEV